jgi:hypothetical protein
MSRPVAEVVAELPPMTAAERRSHKTINRDLSTMATVAKYLATTSWMPRMAGAIVMNFGAGRIAIKSDPDIDTRPPWTTAHLEHLFHSPLYTGVGGALNRLRDDGPSRQVWHDAAYFLPLLLFYHHSCREETCGLEVADVITDHAVPHFLIRDNLTRGRDGETAGEKRRARRRVLPIHHETKRLVAAEDVDHLGLRRELAEPRAEVIGCVHPPGKRGPEGVGQADALFLQVGPERLEDRIKVRHRYSCELGSALIVLAAAVAVHEHGMALNMGKGAHDVLRSANGTRLIG